jgi:hypothetical protein
MSVLIENADACARSVRAQRCVDEQQHGFNPVSTAECWMLSWSCKTKPNKISALAYCVLQV